MAERRRRAIEPGVPCFVTREVVIEGRTAFVAGEKVFVDEIRPGPAGQGHSYAVVSKTMGFRRVLLSDADLSPRGTRREGLARYRIRSAVDYVRTHLVLTSAAAAVILVVVIGGILFATYGFKWKKLYEGAGEKLSVVSVAGENTALAIGSHESEPVLLESRGGAFVPVARGAQPFSDLSGVEGGRAWISGSWGQVYFFDGKSLVTMLDTVSASGAGTVFDEFTGICALDDKRVFVAGNRKGSLSAGTEGGSVPDGSGVLYYYNGSVWMLCAVLPGGSGVTDVAATDPSHAWIVDGSGSIFFFNGATCAVQCRTEAGLFSLCAPSPVNVWAAGGERRKKISVIYHFNGKAWARSTRVSSVLLYDICAVDDRHVWAAGEDMTARAAHGGKSVRKPGEKVSALWFYDGSLWQTFPMPGESDVCRSLSAEQPGLLWAVGQDGLFKGRKSL